MTLQTVWHTSLVLGREPETRQYRGTARRYPYVTSRLVQRNGLSPGKVKVGVSPRQSDDNMLISKLTAG